ncbi:MAG: leucine-rich repeat protein [Clostridia bacterium]|nr:leucine-rich repeat protein [Clostridia bacterium]
MKRLCLLALALIVLFSLFSCTEKAPSTPELSEQTQQGNTSSAQENDKPTEKFPAEENPETKKDAPAQETQTTQELEILADDGYTYTISVSNGKARITSIKYGIYYSKESDETMVLPTELGGYPVTEVGCLFRLQAKEVILPETLEVFEGFYRCSAQRLHLPKNVRSASSLCYKCGLSEITVDEENPYYTAKDGILYTKDMSTLVCFPEAKSVEQYTLPESVTKIENGAFGRLIRIDRLVLGEHVQEIPEELFGGTTNFGNKGSKNDLTLVVKEGSKAHEFASSLFTQSDKTLLCHNEGISIELM